MMQADQIEVFGQTPNGEPVHRVTLSGGDLTTKVLTFGATIQDLRFDGVDHPLVHLVCADQKFHRGRRRPANHIG